MLEYLSENDICVAKRVEYYFIKKHQNNFSVTEYFTVWKWEEMECLTAANSSALPRTWLCVGVRGECPVDKYFSLPVIFSTL